MLSGLNSVLRNLFDAQSEQNRERSASGQTRRSGRRRFLNRLQSVSAPRITEALEQRLLLTAGDLVQSFGVAGLQASDFTDANGFLDQATAVAVDGQGGTVVGGISGQNGLLLRYTAAGELDTSFGVEGRLILGIFPGGITDIALLETGSGQFNGVLAVGGVVSGNDQDFGVLNITAQGNIATGWGDNGSGLVTIDFDAANSQTDTPRAIVRSGNNVYVAGDSFDFTNNDQEFAVARLTADTGNVLQSRVVSFDSHPSVAGNFQDIAYDVAVDSSNQVVVAGTVFSNAANSDFDFAVTRLNADLTDDNTFGQEVFDFGGNSSDRAFSLALEGTGTGRRIYVGGVSDPFGAPFEDFAIAKLVENGDRDTSFGDGDGLVRQDMRIRAAVETNDRIAGIALQGDTLVAAGQSREVAGFNPQVDFTLGLFNKTTGQRNSFTHTSFFAYREDAGQALAISGTDILVAGTTGLFTGGVHPEFNFGFATNVALARYDSQGQLRSAANGPEFGNGGRVVSSLAELSTTTDSARAVEARTADGKVVAAGLTNFAETFSGAVSVYNADGTLDTSFGIGGRLSVGLFNVAGITDLTVLQDGSGNFDGMLVTGPVLNGGDQDFGVVNLDRNGNIRTGWGDNGTGVVTIDFDLGNLQSATPRAIVQNGNDVYVAGDSRDFANGDSEFAVARINLQTGGVVGTPRLVSFDQHPSVQGNFDDVAYDVAVDSNNRVTLAGTAFSNAAGTGDDFAVVRLNQDLTDDTSFGQEVFDFGGNVSDQAFSVAVEGTGNAISTYVGGFTAFGDSGLEDLALAKLFNNGDRDTSFGGGDGLVIQDTRKVASVPSNDRIAEIAILNGTIVAAGQARQPGGSENRQVDFLLSRFDKGTGTFSGSTFTSFFAFNQDAAHALDIDTQGNIVVAGATGVTTQSTAANLPLQTRSGFDFAKFVDISGSGTALNLGDDGEATITTTIGNALFPAGDVTVANNGGILAGAGLNLPFGNFALPNGNGTALYPFWDDIDSDTGNVFHQETVVDGIPTLIVQWHQRPHFPNIGDVTFQVQIPQSGSVLARFAYQDTFFGDPSLDNGASATIGFQVNGASNQFSFNTPSVFGGSFIEFVGSDTFGIGGESAPTQTNFALARYSSTGALLTSGFGTDGRVVTGFTSLSGSDDEARAVDVLDDGRIVVAGGTSLDPLFAGSFQGAVAVYLADGTLDSTFGIGGRVPIGLFNQQFGPDFEFGLTDVVALKDGSGNFDGVIVTGPVFNPANGEVQFAAMKLTAGGSIASGWGDDGSGIVTIDFDAANAQNSFPRAMAMRGNDLYIAGSTVDFANGDLEFAVVRLNASTGSIVGTPRVVPFDSLTGGQNNDEAFDVTIDSLGRVLLAGSARTGDEDFAVVRLTPDLNNDNTFGQELFEFGSNRQDRATSIVVQETENAADYRVFVGGFTSAGTPPNQNFALAKLGPNGDRDTGFGINGLVIDDFRRTAGATSDDTIAEIQLQGPHIIVGGTSIEPAFPEDGERADFATGRYATSNGARDNTLAGDGTLHTTFFASRFELTGGLAISPVDGSWIQVGASGDINDNFALARFSGPNAAPVVSGLAAVTYTEGDAAKPIAAAATVADADGDNIQSMTISLTNAVGADGASIDVTLSGGISKDAASTATNLVLTGSATAAAYQTVLRTLVYNNPSENPTDAPDRTVTVVAQDSNGGSSTVQTITIDVVPVADPPLVDLNGAATGTGFTAQFSGTALAIVDPAALTVTDADSDNLTSATATITNFQTGDSLAVTASGGITAALVDGVLTLTGSATPAAYQTVLRTLTFNTTSASTAARTIQVRASDGTEGPIATATVNLQAPEAVLDLDGSGGNASAQSDGLLVFAALAGVTNEGQLSQLLSPNATKTVPEVLASVTALRDNLTLDVDGNGAVSAQSDGLLIFAVLAGVTNDAQLAALIAPGAPNSPAQVVAAVNALRSPPAGSSAAAFSAPVLAAVLAQADQSPTRNGSDHVAAAAVVDASWQLDIYETDIQAVSPRTPSVIGTPSPFVGSAAIATESDLKLLDGYFDSLLEEDELLLFA